MKSLFKKVRENKKGFTLAELLVVVAIVGILVAISIPVFTAQLSKARKATNLANLRAAKAAAVAEYLTGEKEGTMYYNYDIASGKATGSETDDRVAKTERKLDDSATSGTAVDGNAKYTKFSVTVTTRTDGTGDNQVLVYGDKE
jgi:prepilin-type N-terminal cleavage/methylation domain-containing protein